MNLLSNVLWLILTMAMLAWLQIRLHREVQLFFLLLTRNPKLAILLFSLVFLPGVFLHELSHYLAAKLLRVRTGRISILPRDKGDGTLQLGFVEISATDPIRESLIGAAPLLAGSVFVSVAGISYLKLDTIWAALVQQGLGEGISELFALFNQPDVWLWLYLALAVSSTMFPSSSDRRPMTKLLIGLVLLLTVVLLFGAGVWLLNLVGPGVTRTLGAASVIFGVSAGLHLMLLIPLALIRRLLVDLIGVKVSTV
jgi:hypothetical protein